MSIGIFLVFGGAEESGRRSDLAQRLPKEKTSVGKLVLPMLPEFGSLCFELQGLVSPPATPEKIGKSRPGAGKTSSVAEIILWIRVPRHKLIQQLLVRFERFGGFAGLGIVIGLGSKDIVVIAHGLDLVCWVPAGFAQQFQGSG